jgi:hypothetical protein
MTYWASGVLILKNNKIFPVNPLLQNKNALAGKSGQGIHV